MYVVGSWFTSSSTVLWNGSPRPTTLLSYGILSDGVLLAQIAATDVASAGSASVTVYDPDGTSNAVAFTIASGGPPATDAVAFQIDPSHSGAATSPCPVSLPSKSLWSVAMAAPSYALIAADKVIALDTANQQLLALDSGSGTAVWGPVSVPGAVAAGYDSSSVYVTTAGGACCKPEVDAFDSGTGGQRWIGILNDGPMGPYYSAPVAADGIVAMTVSGGDVALKQADGSQAWTHAAEGTAGSLAITSSGAYLDFPCTKADYDPASGTDVWNYSPGCSGGGGSVPVLANELMYASDGDSGGSGTVFNAATGAAITSYVSLYPPAFTRQYGFFVNGSGGIPQQLQAVRLSDNTGLWSFAGDADWATAPIVVNQTVFIASAKGTLYALDAVSGQLLSQLSLPAQLQSGSDIFQRWVTGVAPSLQAGHGLLVVPTAGSLVAYAISSK